MLALSNNKTEFGPGNGFIEGNYGVLEGVQCVRVYQFIFKEVDKIVPVHCTFIYLVRQGAGGTESELDRILFASDKNHSLARA